MGFIYLITNVINNKKYVGQTSYTVDFRWKHHLTTSRNNDRDYPLYRAMHKYGEENFSIETIEKIKDEDMDEREKYWIKYYESFGPKGYNATIGGNQPRKYYPQEITDFYLNHPNMPITEILKALNINKTTFYDCLRVTDAPLRGYTKNSGKFKKRKIEMLDKKTGEVLQIFDTPTEACRFLDKKVTSHLMDVCNGLRATCYGYKWREQKEES